MAATEPTNDKQANNSIENDEDDENQNIPAYKVTEKKTLDEYKNLDANDESLRKWKESLGLTSGQTIGDPNDKRKVVVLEMTMYVEGMDPVTYNVEDKAVLESLKKNPVAIKEKSKYHLHVKFRVQHEIVTGLKYVQVSRRSGIRANKMDEVCGSYAPNTTEKPYYEKHFAEGEAPGGLLARGHYTATSTFSDDDGVVHLEVPWCFDIVKK